MMLALVRELDRKFKVDEQIKVLFKRQSLILINSLLIVKIISMSPQLQFN
jgi:hypothetical protein